MLFHKVHVEYYLYLSARLHSGTRSPTNAVITVRLGPMVWASVGPVSWHSRVIISTRSAGSYAYRVFMQVQV